MPTPQLSSGLSRRAWLVGAVAVLLLQAALLWIYYRPAPKGLVGDEITYLQTAREIVAGEGDAGEVLRPTLYSHLLVGLDVRPRHRLPIQFLQLAALLAAALLLRSLTRHLFRAPLAGDLAALGLLLYPTLGAFAHYLWPDVLHVCLWIAVLWILATRRHSAPWLLAAGALLAVAILLRHLLLVFLPVVAIALWLDTTERRDGHLGGDHDERFVGRFDGRPGWSLVWLLLPILLLVTPVLWADWSQDGRLRSASNVRFNLWVGLNDQGRKSLDEPVVYEEYLAYMESAETVIERDEILETKILDLIARDGWPTILAHQLGRQYFRLFDKDTFFTEQLPGGALTGRRRGYKISPGALPTFLRWANYTLYATLLALAAFGLAGTRPRQSRWLQLILVFLAYNLAIFLLLHAKSRYRLQLLPLLVMFSACGLERLLTGTALPTPARRLGAMGAAALLLFLAFGGPFL